MNTDAVKTGIKTLINTNKATLLTGLTSQGKAREIVHLTKAISTPPTGYYFVGIHVLEATGRSRSGVIANTSQPPRSAEYECIIHVEDYAIPVAGEEELYETIQEQFDDFVDRIADLIEDQAWIPDASTSPRYRLPREKDAKTDRRILRSNAQQGWFDEAEQFHSMFTAQLRFTLLEQCVDTSLLY